MATKFSEFITKTDTANVAYLVGYNGLENVKIDPALLGGGGLAGTNYIFVPADGTDVENAIALQAAYNTAKTMSATATNRVTVIAAPGLYNFDSSPFIMDTQYIDLVSLDANKSVIFNSANIAGTISITANDVFVKGVDVEIKKFTIASGLNLLRVENCRGIGEYSFSGAAITSGTFVDCVAGKYSFGGASIASGTFTNCTSLGFSFGGFSTASGIFTNCTTSGDGSFSSGVYTFGAGGTASGTFNNCIALDGYSFGQDASGTFNNCRASDYSFGTSTGNASGNFNYCTGGYGAFGSAGNCSGKFSYCIGNAESFGGAPANPPFSVAGILSGKLYYCRLTSGAFQTVSSGGRTIYCIDGNNNTNNQ